jgi:hypothetical protein
LEVKQAPMLTALIRAVEPYMPAFTRNHALVVPCEPDTLWPLVTTFICADLPAIPTTAPAELALSRLLGI